MKYLIVITNITVIIIITIIFAGKTGAATIQSGQFIIQTNITPAPIPLQSSVQTGFSESANQVKLGQNGKPTRIAISANFIDYGQITPTNPIKRKINISVDPGSTRGYQLFTFENHPLASLLSDGQTIPDTTCDNGACSQNTPSTWTNPFTFGFGYSFDDLLYRQFADLSKNEAMTAIAPQEMTIKLNVGQNQQFDKNSSYQNTLIFLVLPKI